MDPLEGDLERHIVPVRGQRVVLDEDLARLYGVSTTRLNQQVRRNIHRFPRDFIVELSAEEARAIRSPAGDGSRRNYRKPPFGFTEHGAIMLATVLTTPTPAAAPLFCSAPRGNAKSARARP